MKKHKLISISLSPNIEADDVRLAKRLLFQPWEWGSRRQTSVKLEIEFKDYLNIKHAISFNSGRSAFFAALKALDLEEKDEVLMQAFTCNAAANPVIWAKLRPIYVDVNEKTFNMDVDDLKRKITSRSRVLVVQHTFGLASDMNKIIEICRDNNLILIEDCAHSLGATYNGKKAGTFGRLAFFSFSRDKVISSVYGGMAVTDDDYLAEKIFGFREKIGGPGFFWTVQQILHPILLNDLILPTYAFLGKYLLVLFQWLHILSKAVHWREKRGKRPGYFPKALPDALAALALNQFEKLEAFNEHRKMIADFYATALANYSFVLPGVPEESEHIFLRFTLRHPKAHEIIRQAWRSGILIGDWYTSPIAPKDTHLDAMGYNRGSCPKAEELAKTTLNLPTHINISGEEVARIVSFLKKYEDSQYSRKKELGRFSV